MLIEFMTEPDPLYAMLEWLTSEPMKLEAENKVGAQKGEHCLTRTTFLWNPSQTIRYSIRYDLSSGSKTSERRLPFPSL